MEITRVQRIGIGTIARFEDLYFFKNRACAAPIHAVQGNLIRAAVCEVYVNRESGPLNVRSRPGRGDAVGGARLEQRLRIIRWVLPNVKHFCAGARRDTPSRTQGGDQGKVRALPHTGNSLQRNVLQADLQTAGSCQCTERPILGQGRIVRFAEPLLHRD